ncbi:MAG: hypothetical protein WCG78_01270 [Candidatus Omnitrophota bacterium]
MKRAYRVCGYILPAVFFAAVMLSFMSGCEQMDRQSLDRIARQDPAFRQVLAKKERIDSKAALLSSQFQAEKDKTYAQIRLMQEELNRHKQDVDSKLAVLKRELDPERSQLQEEGQRLASLAAEKRSSLRELEATRRNLSELIRQQKAVNVTTADMTKWQERLSALNAQIDPLKTEIRVLEEKMTTVKTKSLALRQ